jgi:hypothetical protein
MNATQTATSLETELTMRETDFRAPAEAIWCVSDRLNAGTVDVRLRPVTRDAAPPSDPRRRTVIDA